jgi:PAS domain S-box-containing protein
MGLKRADILIGWKEIAEYLGCSVATAIRRERDGLPVFRSGGQVRAFHADIDKWLKGLRAIELNSISTAETVEEIEETEDISGILATLLRHDNREKLAVIRMGKDVAEFERIEVQLKSAEEKYRNLVEEIPEWIWEVDAEGEFVYSSPGVLEILGYEPEELVGFTAEEFLVHPDDRNKYRATMERLTGQKEIIHGFLCRYVHREGSVRHVETSASPVFNASGNSARIKGISRDVTERVRLEGKITETRRYLENVLQGSMDAIITTDIDGRVVTWNRGAEAIYGYYKEEAVGKYLDKLVNPRGDSRVFRELFIIIEEKGGWYAEEPIEKRRKDGTALYASASYSIVYGADGKPVGICAITRDITDRLNAERFTREALSRFESVFENVPNVAVQGFGPDGRIRHWNPAAKQIFNYSVDEVIGEPVETLPFLRDEDQSGFKDVLDKIFTSGEPGPPREFSFVGPDGGRRWVYSQMFPVFVEGEVEEVFQMSVDITDRKRAEDAITAAAEEWRRTFDTVPDLISIIDDECRILRLNKAMAEKIGVEPKEALGRYCYEALNGTDEPCEFCPHVRSPAEDTERKIETYFIKPGRYYEVTVSPVNDAGGERIGSVHVARDITERKRAVEGLREIEQRFNKIARNLPEGAVHIIDKDLRYVYNYGEALKEIGLSNEDLAGKTVYDVLPPDTAQTVADNYERALKGEPVSFEAYFAGRNFLVNAVPLERFNGEIGQILALSTDITDRMRAENALKESEEKYRSLVEQATDGIAIIQDGRILFVNRPGASLLGYTPEELVGMEFSEILVPESRYELEERYRRRMGGEDVPPIYETKLLPRKGEAIDVEINAGVINYNGRPADLAFGRDIRDRKKAEYLARVHRDLCHALCVTADLDEAFALCKEAAIQAGGMDSGGVYLVNEATGGFDLVSSKGLSPDYVKRVSRYEADSPEARLIMTGKPVYSLLQELGIPLGKARRGEGLRAVAFVPVFYEGKVIACLNVASHELDEISVSARDALETIAAQIGGVFARIRAEEALKESEDKYRNLVETVKEGIGITDPAENLTFVNKAFAEVLGYTVGELTGMNLQELTTRKGYDKILKETEKRRSGESSRYAIEMKHKDGRRLDFLISATPLYTEDRSYAGTAATVTRLPELGLKP